MKHIISIIALSILSFQGLFAQSTINNIYNKYSETKGVTTIYISETMLSLGMDLAASEIEDIDIKSIGNKLTGLYIINSENTQSIKEIKQDIKKLNLEGYEILMKVRDEGDKIDFLIKKEKGKNTYSHLAMIIEEDDEIVLMFFQGKGIKIGRASCRERV